MVNALHGSVALGPLIRRIADDQFSIPDFQREFVWTDEDIRQLMRSLFNEYSVGSLLLWNLRDATMQELLGCKSLLALHKVSADSEEAPQAEGSDKPPFTAPPVTVLDGQQRLTAMYYAFFDRGPSPDGKTRQFFVDVEKFMSKKANEPAEDGAFICRGVSRRAPNDRSSLPKEDADEFVLYDETQSHEFPLRLLSTSDWTEWLSEYQRFWRSKAREHEKRAQAHAQQAQEYFRQAQEAEEAGGEEYTEYYKLREQAREAATAANKDAEDASSAVASQQAKVDDLRKDYHHLDDQLKSSSNSAKKRDYGTARHQLERTISREEFALNDLMETAAEKREKANQLEDERRRLAEEEQSMAAGNGRPDPDTLRIQALDEEDSQNRYSDRSREADAHAADGRNFADFVRALREEFHILVMELPEGMSEIAVSETFQQINRRGTKLQTFDLLNAAVSLQHVSPRNMLNEVLPDLEADGLAWDRTRADLVRMMFIRTHPESRYGTQGDTYEDLVPGRIRIGSNQTTPLIKSAEDFEHHWRSVQQNYVLGMRALRDETHYGKEVPDNPGHFVPFDGMIPVYCSLLADAGDSVTRRLRANQWYWASVLTERYSTSGGDSRRASTSQIGSRDYREVQEWFKDDHAIPEAVAIFRDEFGLGLFSAASGRPRSRSLGFVQGVRNLMFTFSPRGWLDGDVIPAAGVADYEVVPLEQCADIGVSNAVARSVFNTMLVDQASQEEIEGTLPNAYVQRFLQERALGFRRELLASHCISDRAHEILLRDPFTSNHFDEFLRERQTEFLRRIALEVFAGLDLELPE